jgi:hypothetical protein
MIANNFTEVTGCAAAGDGGSLWVELAGPDGKAGFVIVRSIAARGTPMFGRVRSDEGGSLSADDTRQLCQRLSELRQSSPSCNDLVAEFVQTALAHAA